MSNNISGVAATAETVLEDVMKVEPMIANMAGTFGGPVVGTAVNVIQPEILFLVPFLENALKQVAGTDNISGQIGAVIELAKHLLPGQPNSPALDPSAPPQT